MKYYELTYLISPELSTEEIEKFQEKLRSLIIEGGGLDKIGNPIRKKLAYPIKKKNEAFLATLNFYLNPGKLEDLEKKLKGEEKILRFLIVTKKRPKILPEILVKPGKIVKPKVELKEIEKKLEEILGE